MRTIEQTGESANEKQPSIPLSLLIGCVSLAVLIALNFMPLAVLRTYILHTHPVFIMRQVIIFIVLPIVTVYNIVQGHVTRRTEQRLENIQFLGRNDAGLLLNYVILLFIILQLRF